MLHSRFSLAIYLIYGAGLVAKMCQTFVTPWTVACLAHLSMEFSKQEYWSGLPYPSSGDLPEPGIEPGSPALQTDSLLFELPRKPPLRRQVNLNI